MVNEADKIAAATLAAAILRPPQGSGEEGELERAQSKAAKRAATLYHEILAAIVDPPR
jgi:hypothetical protein